MASYYAGREESLKDIFGAKSVTVTDSAIVVDGRTMPVVDDVILAIDPARAPARLRHLTAAANDGSGEFAADIQQTFGDEWGAFPRVMPEHETEFRQYFDVVDLETLRGKRVADLGCGIGRWSHFLRGHARELVLVDFSEAIFVASRNLRDAPHAIFILADLQRLPFRDDFADFVLCLGVLHHLPVDALAAVRGLARYAPVLLIYLYSALDGRPFTFRLLFGAADLVRRGVSRINNRAFRTAFTWAATLFLYLPFIALGALLRPFGLARFVPLFDFYRGKSLERIRQDAYDRFFTGIEQRVRRDQILALTDTFAEVTVSPGLPRWHFLCRRDVP